MPQQPRQQNRKRQGGGGNKGGGGPKPFIAWASSTTDPAKSFTPTANKGEYDVELIVGRSDPNPQSPIPCKITVQGKELAGIWNVKDQITITITIKPDLAKPDILIEIDWTGRTRKADDPADSSVKIASSKIKPNKGKTAGSNGCDPLIVNVSLPGPDGRSNLDLTTTPPGTGKPATGTVIIRMAQEFKINGRLVNSGSKSITVTDGHWFGTIEPMVENEVGSFVYLEANCTVEAGVAKKATPTTTATP